MMKLNTKYLGEVNIKDEEIIRFSKGLPGFDEETGFVLLDFPGNPVFQFLQSVSTVDLSFIVTNPYQFYHDYEFDLDDNLVESLHIQSEKDVAVFSIVTLKDPFKSSTINLKAPVIINSTKRQGKQYILTTDEYISKAPLFPIATVGKENNHAHID